MAEEKKDWFLLLGIAISLLVIVLMVGCSSEKDFWQIESQNIIVKSYKQMRINQREITQKPEYDMNFPELGISFTRENFYIVPNK